MAFHFDAQADSSDDGDAIDLSAWKAGAQRRSPVAGQGRAPVAPMMGSSARQEAESSATPDLSDFNRKGEAPAALSPPRIAFQPINDLNQESSAGDQDLEIQSISSAEPSSAPVEQDQDDQEQEQVGSGGRKLVVQISRTEGDDRDDYDDYTAGSQTVRRVLWEVRPISGQVAYQVLFEDFHHEAVCFFSLSSFPTHPKPGHTDMVVIHLARIEISLCGLSHDVNKIVVSWTVQLSVLNFTCNGQEKYFTCKLVPAHERNFVIKPLSHHKLTQRSLRLHNEQHPLHHHHIIDANDNCLTVPIDHLCGLARSGERPGGSRIPQQQPALRRGRRRGRATSTASPTRSIGKNDQHTPEPPGN